MSLEQFIEDYGDCRILVSQTLYHDEWEYCIQEVTIDQEGKETWKTIHKGLNSYENGAICLKLAREFMAKFIAPHHKT